MVDEPPVLEVIGSGHDDDRAPGLLDGVSRGWRAAAAAVLALAAAVTVGPELVSSGGRDVPPASSSRSTLPPAEPPTADWPVRGNLAGDRGYLRSVLARVRLDHPEAERVLYAATLPDGGSVAFVGRDRDDTVGVRALNVYAVRVLPGQRVAAGEVTLVGRGLIESTGLMGWAGRGRGGTVYAALLSPPGPLVAQVSSGIRYAPDGTATRDWRGVRGRDGSVIVDLGPRTDPAIFARSRRSRLEVPIMMPLHDGRDQVTIAGLGGPGYDGPAPSLVATTAIDACRGLMDLREAAVRVIWSGEVSRGAHAALLRIRRPDGPAFQLLVGEHSGSQPFAHGPLRVPWDGADVLPWLFESGDPSRPLVLLNPTGRGTVSVSYPEEPARVVRVGRTGAAPFGVGAPTYPNLYQAVVEVRTPADRLVVKAPLTTVSTQDPFLLDL